MIKTFTQVLTGTLTALVVPSGLKIDEIHMQAASGFSLASSSTDPEFPVAVGVIYRMPFQTRGTSAVVYVKGAGTLTCIAYGQNNPG
jgi:hypothetical protein